MWIGNWNGSKKERQKIPRMREDLEKRTAKTCESESASSVEKLRCLVIGQTKENCDTKQKRNNIFFQFLKNFFLN